MYACTRLGKKTKTKHKNFNRAFKKHILLVLPCGKRKGEASLGLVGQWRVTTYLDPVLSVEVCCTQAGIEAVAQALQQPHSWEQLTFVLKPSRGK